MAVTEDFNPYAENIIYETTDRTNYKNPSGSWVGGGGVAAFTDVDFGETGAKQVKISIGGANGGTSSTPVRVWLYDGELSNVKETDISGYIHDTSGADIGEQIATASSGQSTLGWYTPSEVTVNLTRVIKGTHGIYVASASGVNVYSIQFIEAEKETVNPPVYSEDFNDALDSSLWITAKKAGSLDGTYSRSGTSYKFPGNGYNISYGTASYPNHVYEVWMYYLNNSPENKQIIVSGTDSSGAKITATAQAHSAYNYFRVPNTTTKLSKTEGWHKFLVDCTDLTSTKFYIDGTMVGTASKAFAAVTSITLEDGSTSAVWFDDFKIYSSYKDVPASKSAIIASILFDTEAEVNGATEVIKDDGNINITYENEMSELTASNFALYKKAASGMDSAYELVEDGITLSDESTTTKSVISVANLESVTKYRIYFKDLKTAQGTIMEDDFIEFTTGNVDARRGTVYSEDFEDTLGTEWTASGFYQDAIHSRSLLNSYRSTKSGSSMTLDVSSADIAAPNSIYEVWFYYQQNTTEHKEFMVKGSDGKWMGILAHSANSTFHVRSYNGASTSSSSTGVAKTEGWHRLLIDFTDSGSVKFYIDDTLGKTVEGTFESVSRVAFDNGVDGTNSWFDDFKIYDSMTYVPACKQEIIDAIEFDNGTNAENASGVGKFDGNINVSYVNAMSDITENNFVLYKKAADSVSDGDYILAENGITLSAESTTTKSVISIADLQPDTMYRIYFKGLTTAGGVVMEDDFIEFTTAETINLLDTVVKDIRFDNNIKIPTKGIPSATCGDLTITFAAEMNPDTITTESIILEKITDESGVETAAAIDYKADVTASAYVIDSDSMNLEPSSTYRLTIKPSAVSADRNYLAAAESYEFSTSSDSIKQEPAVSDDLEDTSDWTLAAESVGEESAHSGSYAFSLGSGEVTSFAGELISNGVYEIWLYDAGSASDDILLQLEGENGENVQFGIKNGQADRYWITGDILVGTRNVGWHRFIVNFVNPDSVEYYIDDILVATREEGFDEVTSISICNQSASGNMLADDFKIWNLMDYEVISKVEENKAFICDENYNVILDYSAGDKVYIALNVDNGQDEQQDAVLAVGEYKNDALTNVKVSESVTVAPGESAMLRVEYTIPENFEEYELKAFCWESLTTAKPVMPETNPKEITAVFLGGGITAGVGAADSANSYVSLTGDYLKENLGGEETVKIVNSGVSGKGSDFGSKYFEAYVGAYAPDILFVEYAADDRIAAGGAEIPVKKHMEEIVQKALALPKKPKIVFVYAAGSKLDSCTDWHNEIAEYYDIPVVDLVAAVKTDIIGDEAATAWEDDGTYLANEIYPTDAGHAFYAEKIIDALKTEGFMNSIAKKEPQYDVDAVAVNTDIMSFNICISGLDTNAWSYRKEAVVSLLSSSGADVIGMQEVSTSQYEYIKENIDDKYDVIHYIRGGEVAYDEGPALAYNTEVFEKVSEEVFWLSETPDVASLGWDAEYYRICVNALLKHKETGEMLNVFDVHLDHVGSESRQKGLALVVQRAKAKGYQSVVMGDFNFQKSNTACYSAIADEMIDCQQNAETTENGGTYQNFGSVSTQTPIDYIFVSKENMKPLTFDILTEKWTNDDGEEKYYSDHYPIKATVEVTYDID
ncbi:MAG: endonuclease/exonuclease/phosphatase family protein [Clostridia bacterium]|nr:endonuclease/exonuclease/phosphatase family protein [Clostridia bacterium]